METPVDDVLIQSFEQRRVNIFKLQELLRPFIILPEGIELYLVDAQWLFPIRGERLGDSDSLIYYLVRRGNPDGTEWFKQGVILADLFKTQADSFLANIVGAGV